MNLTTLTEIAALADPIERARALGVAMAEQQALVEEAARMRRQAIAEARETGHRLDEIANVLGVSPGRISQMRKGSATRAPGPPAERAPQIITHRSLPTRPGCVFLTAADQRAIRPEARMLGVGHEPASDHVASCLRVRPGDDVLTRRTLMLADGVPVRIAGSFFRADLFDGTRLAGPDLIEPSLQDAIDDLGHVFGHAEETLVARPATRAEAETLRLGPAEWVVQVLRAAYSADDTPIHVMETVCAATRHVFTIDQAGAAERF